MPLSWHIGDFAFIEILTAEISGLPTNRELRQRNSLTGANSLVGLHARLNDTVDV